MRRGRRRHLVVGRAVARVVIAWWLVACGGKDDAASTSEPICPSWGCDDTATTPTTPTVEPPITYFPASDLFVSARFGWDAPNQRVDVVQRINGTFEYPVIEVILATADWDGNLAAVLNYCSILFVLESSARADWVSADPRLVYGVDWDPAPGALTNCNPPLYRLDPFVWGFNVVDRFVADSTWGVAVGALQPALAGELQPLLGDDFVYAIGGTFRVGEVLGGGAVTDVYGYGYAVDADLVLTDAEGDGRLDALLAADVLADLSAPADTGPTPGDTGPTAGDTGPGTDTAAPPLPQLPSGWYVLDTTTFWSVDP